MVRSCIFFLLLLIISVLADPKVVSLSQTNSHGSLTFTVESGGQIYLASGDDNQLLKNIQLTTGSTTIPLDQLNVFNNDGTPKFITATGSVILTTSNNATTSAGLSGYIYVTTYQQAQDPTFSVCVLKTTQSIRKTTMKSTVVVLNTILKQNSVDYTMPRMTSYVTKINSSPNTNLKFHWDIPALSGEDGTKNVFFQNPIVLRNEEGPYNVFFDNVEPLQVGLNYWYFTSNGPVNMFLENKYISDISYWTTAVNTTGLIMNKRFYTNHIVYFRSDATRSAVSGVFESAYLTSSLTIKISGQCSSFGENFNNQENITQATAWVELRPVNMTVTSTSVFPGTFYIQYFAFAGNDPAPKPMC
ncbi:CUB_2 domain-containing protein [Caenorhabditis elegans]|uniref:CUB_2 domain-containing protein n=1 Tax=Caenorhabditis elegans TaxID=6239 RepID=Q2L6V4_CAEEL|nr:CUB_2 domain-containing protein [Caenorhabditis elegans]CCD70981.1 CUB_2 domain-containing protein [Caenorhabditis elegans]|eukprot:NP_001040975.1 Uncharacterized protein CELE_K11H12.11 [Caenorhabditis elegans]